MSEISGKSIAELLVKLNVKWVRWSRIHLEQVFSTNGKGEEKKLTIQQFHILIHIRDLGLNTVSQISNSLCLSKSSTSLSIGKLVEKGYLKKEHPSQEDDGRKTYFHLTEKGHTVMKGTENMLMEFASSYFDSFDNDTKEALFNHLYAINHLLSIGGNVK